MWKLNKRVPGVVLLGGPGVVVIGGLVLLAFSPLFLGAEGTAAPTATIAPMVMLVDEVVIEATTTTSGLTTTTTSIAAIETTQVTVAETTTTTEMVIIPKPMPWFPPETTTTTVLPEETTATVAVKSVWHDVFIEAGWPESAMPWVLSTLWCESKGIPSNVGRYGERGLMQIHPVHRDMLAANGIAWDSMFDPATNARAALLVFRLQGSRAWTCSPYRITF